MCCNVWVLNLLLSVRGIFAKVDQMINLSLFMFWLRICLSCDFFLRNGRPININFAYMSDTSKGLRPRNKAIFWLVWNLWKKGRYTIISHSHCKNFKLNKHTTNFFLKIISVNNHALQCNTWYVHKQHGAK